MDLTSVLNAARRWINDCLIGDGAILSDEQLWTPPVVEELRAAYVDNPDFGKGDFVTKLVKQLEAASDPTKRLAAEMIWALLLFPSNIKAATKRDQIVAVWELSGVELDTSIAPLSDAVLGGIGSGGAGFNNYRHGEFEYLLKLVSRIKSMSLSQRKAAFDSYNGFMALMGQVPPEGDRQFRHMLRYFSFPDVVERISSNRDRRKILAAFKVAAGKTTKAWSDSQLDEALQKLRAERESEHPGVVLDFYEAPLLSVWKDDPSIPEDQEASEGVAVEGKEEVEKSDINKKYFSLERIEAASKHLEKYHSSWVIPAFLLASSGANSQSEVDLGGFGTDSFLDKFFNGSLIGLPAFSTGNNTLRPRFSDLLGSLKKRNASNDSVIQQNTKLWANAYSSRGYREMANRGEIKISGRNRMMLTDKFQPALEEGVPDTFRFEELLVWIFAFRGVPKEVGSWSELKSEFLSEETNGLDDFSAEFLSRFAVHDDYPWPTDFLDVRPSNVDYRTRLMPSLVAVGDAADVLSDDDPIWVEITRAIEERGERNFLFYGPPATSKTWYARGIARKLADNDPVRMKLIQFHPAYSYDDFAEGLSSKIDEEKGTVFYKHEKKHFLLLCKEAAKLPKKRFVIVIDEISRGDPSRVFGDLLTYIEAQYRNLPFTLGYSGEEARVPDNVIIIGTVNPYDRSVAEMDDAFVRRFYLKEFPGSKDLLKAKMDDDQVDGDVSQRILHLYQSVSDALPYGFGHAHFFGLVSREDVVLRWETRLRFLIARALSLDAESLAEVTQTFEQLFGKQVPSSDGNSVAQ